MVSVFFFCTKMISANFSSLEKLAVFMFSLKTLDKCWEIIPLFNFNLLTSISAWETELFHSEVWIYFAIRFSIIDAKWNFTKFLINCFILKILGWFLYFCFAIFTGSVSLQVSFINVSLFSTFNALTTFLKDSLIFD